MKIIIHKKQRVEVKKIVRRKESGGRVKIN